MDKRLGTIGILIEDRRQAPSVNALLGEYGHLVIGRIGVPCRDKGIGVISLIVEGTTDEVGALSGKLGMLAGVKSKSLLLTK